MAYLEKGFKLTKASKEMQVIGTHIPVFGFRRIDGWLNRQYYFQSFNTGYVGEFSGLREEILNLTGCTNEEELFGLLQTIDGAKIQNRKLEDIPINESWLEFAIYDEEGKEVTEVSGEVYRPAIRVTGWQGGPTWSYGYVGEGQGGLVSASGFTTNGSSSHRNYWIGFLAEPYVEYNTNYFFAVGIQDASRPLDYEGIDGFGLVNIFRSVSTYFAGGRTSYTMSYIEFNIYRYSTTQGYYFELTSAIPKADPDLQPEDETSEPGGYGGRGAHDHTSDLIGIPDDPTVSTASVGFFHIYKVSMGALSGLGQYLFPSISNIDSVEAALRAMAGIFAYRDNVQYIVDLHAVPVSPTLGASDYIRVGALSTDISAPTVASDYVNVSCGSVSIPENYANFLDYVGTRCRLYLPFVGFVDIRPEYFQSGTLSVDYKFNIVDGSFMAYVRATSSKSQLSASIVGQYSGSACIHFPVLAQSYGSLVSGLVSGAQIAAGATPGNAGQAAESAVSIMQAMQFQPQLQQSNNYNASSSFLGSRTPYLIIDRAVPSFAAYYNKDEGLPTNVTTAVSQVSGYTEIANIDFIGDTYATDTELEEIRQLLSEGVFL